MGELLKNIDESIDRLIELGKETFESTPLHIYDLYCSAVLNKYVNLLRGFTALMKDNNYIAAVPLLRVHLNLLLQLYASTLVSGDVDEFAKKVFKGRRIQNMKDREGKLMRDRYLAKKISNRDGLDWAFALYDNRRSGYVRYSDYIAELSVHSFLEDEGKVMSIILSEDGFATDVEKLEISIKINHITENMVTFINTWKAQKKDYVINRTHKTITL